METDNIIEYLPQDYINVLYLYAENNDKSIDETCSIFIKNYIDEYYNCPNVFYMSEENYNKIMEDDGLDEDTLKNLRKRYKEYRDRVNSLGMI
jgi:hypothetical protein